MADPADLLAQGLARDPFYIRVAAALIAGLILLVVAWGGWFLVDMKHGQERVEAHVAHIDTSFQRLSDNTDKIAAKATDDLRAVREREVSDNALLRWLISYEFPNINELQHRSQKPDRWLRDHPPPPDLGGDDPLSRNRFASL